MGPRAASTSVTRRVTAAGVADVGGEGLGGEAATAELGAEGLGAGGAGEVVDGDGVAGFGEGGGHGGAEAAGGSGDEGGAGHGASVAMGGCGEARLALVDQLGAGSSARACNLRAIRSTQLAGNALFFWRDGCVRSAGRELAWSGALRGRRDRWR